jgi:hypothetical protein
VQLKQERQQRACAIYVQLGGGVEPREGKRFMSGQAWIPEQKKQSCG